MRLDPITLMTASHAKDVVPRRPRPRALVGAQSRQRKADWLYEFVWQRRLTPEGGRGAAGQQVMPDDHSKVAPLLPIPNRTVKRLSADDSADSRVKVGHRQARSVEAPPCWWGRFLLQNTCCAKESARRLHDLKKLCYNLRLR